MEPKFDSMREQPKDLESILDWGYNKGDQVTIKDKNDVERTGVLIDEDGGGGNVIVSFREYKRDSNDNIVRIDGIAQPADAPEFLYIPISSFKELNKKKKGN
jgi:hypothetical protein